MGNYVSKLFLDDDDNHEEVIANNSLSTKQTELSVSEELKLHASKICEGQSQSNDDVNCTYKVMKDPINVLPKYLQSQNTNDKIITNDNFDISVIGEQWLDPRSPNSACPRTPVMIKQLFDSPSQNPYKWIKLKSNILNEKQQLSTDDLDPRSPANDFDRTPILKTRTMEPLRKLIQKNKLKEIDSNDDDSVKPSYCETTSLFSVPEIQAFPDVLLCNTQQTLNKLSLSSENVELNLVSENNEVTDESLSVNVESTDICIPNLEKQNSLENDDIKKTENHLITEDKNSSEVPTDVNEQFVVWRDSSENLSKTYTISECDNNTVIDDVEINMNTKLKESEDVIEGNKQRSIEKEEIKTKEIKKQDKKAFNHNNSINRTPLGNRLNRNRLIEAKSINMKYTLNKDVLLSKNNFQGNQENTPPIHTRRQIKENF